MSFLFSFLRLSSVLAVLLASVFFAPVTWARDIPVFVAPKDRLAGPAEAAWPHNQFVTLSYHDVNDTVADQRYMAVRTDNLIEQFNWLRENGYQPVSIAQILAARQGGPALPPKATLLTFDDGFSSFFHRVLPVLRTFQWPAVLAPVGAWVDTPQGQEVDFGGLPTPREQMATWAQIKAIADSGLVEIGAHTQNMHYGVQANPQGSMQPVAVTRIFDAKTGTYESDETFRERTRKDITTITQKIRQVTGQSPRVWVWPYGEPSAEVIAEAKKQGYQLFMTLGNGLGDVKKLDNIPRILIADAPSLSAFARLVTSVQNPKVARVAHVDLDYVYSSDPAETEKNLGLLVQRVKDMRISTVYLQAFADPKGDGTVRELYFPNRWLPMRSDLFGRAAWQLRTRAGVSVYAWMPVLSYDFGDHLLPHVQSWNPHTGATTVAAGQYQRLSPFDPTVRRKIGDVYEDLAKHSAFAGVLFHDDAILSDFEDVGPQALAAYAAAGLPASPQALRADPDTLQRWTRFKSKYLVDFTLELRQRVRAIRGEQILTARNIFAQPILQPESETWFAQNLDDFLQAYDWTAPMAMPLMENVPTNEINPWLDQLVDAVARRPGALGRTVFELQALDWRAQPQAQPVPNEQLVGWMQRLQQRGALNYGYYPDNFVKNHPDLHVLRSNLSNYWFIQP